MRADHQRNRVSVRLDEGLSVIGATPSGGGSIDGVAVLRTGTAASSSVGTAVSSAVGSGLRAHEWSDLRQLDTTSATWRGLSGTVCD